MRNEIRDKIDEFAKFLPLIAEENETEFQAELIKRIDHINELSLGSDENRKEEMKYCFNICGEELDKSILNRHVRNKPLGYAGDYQILDWIYTNKADSKGRGLLWDKLFQRLPATQAVRNRKDFFCDFFSSMFGNNNRDTSVLDIASGSGRPIIEALKKCRCDAAKTYAYCIDHDVNAIEYSKRLKVELAPDYDIQWDNRNFFRLKPENRFNLVWTGGVYEYLNDRLAIALLKRMWEWTKSGGKTVFGIFHPSNPTRNWMDWCGEWFQIYRTKEDILRLCDQAGIPTENINFEFEPLKINLFTIIEKR